MCWDLSKLPTPEAVPIHLAPTRSAVVYCYPVNNCGDLWVQQMTEWHDTIGSKDYHRVINITDIIIIAVIIIILLFWSLRSTLRWVCMTWVSVLGMQSGWWLLGEISCQMESTASPSDKVHRWGRYLIIEYLFYLSINFKTLNLLGLLFLCGIASPSQLIKCKNVITFKAP